MIRLSANLSRKLPVPGIDFSSQQYGAGLEIEVADAVSAEELQAKIRSIYGSLEKAIDAEISASLQAQEAQPVRAFLADNSNGNGRHAPDSDRRSDDNGHSRPGRNGNGNGNGRKRQATVAQVKAVYAIARASGISKQDLAQQLEQEYMVTKPEQLTVMQASQVIEGLKAQQQG